MKLVIRAMAISSKERFSFWISMYCPGDGQSRKMPIPGEWSQMLASRAGLRIRQWPQQHRVHNAENGAVSPDADGQRKHHYDGQAGVLAQHAHRVPEIL